MGDHVLYRKLSGCNGAHGDFGGVIVGGKRALKADLAPDDEVDVDGNVDAVSGEAANYQSAEGADTFDRSPYRLNVAGNIDDNVGQLAAGFLSHHVQDAFLFDVNGSVGAEFLGNFQSLGVSTDAANNDARGAGASGRKGTGKPLLPRSLNQHVVAHFDAALAYRPLKAIGQSLRLREPLPREVNHR